MTEVNRSNYQSIFPEIITKIQNCTFVAIDAEFTGLHSSDPKLRRSLFDSGSRRYEKTQKSLTNSKYIISQFGLAIFKKESWDENNWSLDAYNVFLFPAAFGNYNQTETFDCQVSSSNFLSEYNFDFNKFIREGVPYLRPDEEITLRKYLNQDKELITQLRGFTQILQTVQETKKPLIGHNCFLDLILILNQFYQPLPQEYQEFKQTLTSIFPTIYDTKYIAIALENNLIATKRTVYFDYKTLNDSGLYELYKNTIIVTDFISPVVEPLGGAVKYKDALLNPAKVIESENFHHEAGFDASLTGIIFLQLSHISLRRQGLPSLTAQAPTVTDVFMNVIEWVNRLHMMRGTIQWMNLVGPDPSSHRPKWISFKIPKEGDQYPTMEAFNNLLGYIFPMYGDIETQVDEDKNLMTIACTGIVCQERLSKELQERGFEPNLIDVPVDQHGKIQRGTWGKMFSLLGMVILGGILIIRRSR